MPLTIIIGTGRCGSTMLSRMLNLHPQVLSLSEFWNLFPGREINSSVTGEEFWQMITRPDPVFDGIIMAGIPLEEYFYPYDRARFDPATGVPSICRVLAAVSHDPDTLYDKLALEVTSWPRQLIAGHCRALFRELATMLGREVIVERTGAAVAMLPQLRTQFPDARFIFLHRDGPDCALSMSRHPLFLIDALNSLADILSNPSPPETPSEEALFERMKTIASPAELRSLSTPPFDAERMMTFPFPTAYFGWLWSVWTRTGTNAIRMVRREDWVTLRYEQLLKDTRSELTRLSAFIGVPAERQWLDEVCDLVDPSRLGKAAARLDHGELTALQAVCAAGTRAFDLLESEAHPSSTPDGWPLMERKSG